MKQFLSLVALMVPGVAFATSVTVESAKVAYVKVDGKGVPYILVERLCQRETSTWEKLNNGLKDYTTCDDFAVEPKASHWEGMVIPVNSDSSFDIPETKATYSWHIFKRSVYCVRIEPVSELTKFDGNDYPKTIYTKENLIYCTESPTPDFMSSTLGNQNALLFDSFRATLGKGVNFTAAH